MPRKHGFVSTLGTYMMSFKSRESAAVKAETVFENSKLKRNARTRRDGRRNHECYSCFIDPIIMAEMA